MIEIDLSTTELRDSNRRLQSPDSGSNQRAFRLLNPHGKHALAVGLKEPIEVEIAGHTGFYCGGMNQQASITVEGHVGPGVAENMMSGQVRVKGNASQSAGASGHGGLLVIEGDAASRCGISMKGIDIVVQGSIGHFGAFMGQKGRLVVCGDAGAGLGDSLYEAVLYVCGKVDSLGADCIEKDMTDAHKQELATLLETAGVSVDPDAFRRYGSARQLYHFTIDKAEAY